jgi:hypothetical protein
MSGGWMSDSWASVSNLENPRIFLRIAGNFGRH